MKVAILSGSVYGTAEEVARHAQQLLVAASLEAWYQPRAQLADIQAFGPEAFLVVTSTTGMGELPENLQPLCHECHSRKTQADMGKAVCYGCDSNGWPLDPASHWQKSPATDSPEPPCSLNFNANSLP